MNSPQHLILTAAALADDRGVIAAPGAMLLRQDRAEPGDTAAATTVLEVGSPAKVRRLAPIGAARADLAGSVLIPGMVNAHTHLDLTSVGPIPYDESRGFAGWIADVRAGRATDEAAIAASVRDGIERSRASGVVAVGDIAGAWSPVPISVLRDSPMLGVAYLECFGLGDAGEMAADRMARLILSLHEERSAAVSTGGGSGGVRLGIQPHAPYSAGGVVYRRACELADRLGLPLATHLAESVAERELVAMRAGPIRAALESFGVWDESAAAEFGAVRSPTEHLGPLLARARWLVAHANDCSDEDIDLLARTGATVVYCPRASEYFGHHREVGPHRYREMIERGVAVALGTDSVISLPAEQSSRLSVLDDARLLRRRDEVAPVRLLGMITTAAASALGLPPDLFRFTPGPIAGIAAVRIGSASTDPVAALFETDSIPTLLGDRNHSCLAETDRG